MVGINYIWTIYVRFYIKLQKHEKTLKLQAILDALDFNQVVIFVNSDDKAWEVDSILTRPSCLYPSTIVLSTMYHEEKTHCVTSFHDGEGRILVSSGLVSFGPWANIIINFDTPLSMDHYLSLVGRNHNRAMVSMSLAL